MTNSAIDVIAAPQGRQGVRLRKTLIAVEAVTAAAAAVGGLLLIIAPDGHLLAADPTVLSNGPFASWRVPGFLLLSLVGGGFTVASVAEWREFRYARLISRLAGAGLWVFEGFELVWLGFQPLQAVFAGVGLAVVVLSVVSGRRSRS